MLRSKQPIVAFATLLVALSGCHGASNIPTGCVGEITEFPNCEKVNSIIAECSDLTKQETIDCFCTQELLDAYVGCKGEFRQCGLSDSHDNVIDAEIDNWDETCNPYLPKDITTPSAAAATGTVELNDCQTIVESCAQLSQSISACSSSYTRGADITSCRCQDEMVSLASVCDIDGREKCERKTLATSEIWEFRNCEAATEFLGASTTEENTGPITEAADEPTAEDGATTLVFGPTSTAASTTSAGSAVVCPCMAWRNYLLLVLPVAYALIK